MKLYKIRHKVTGLYSKGGASPYWSKKGKTWSSIGHLKRHIAGVVDSRYHKMSDMVNWEILEIEVSETLTPIGTAMDIALEREKKNKEKEQQWARERAEREFNKKQAIAKLTPEERKALNL